MRTGEGRGIVNRAVTVHMKQISMAALAGYFLQTVLCLGQSNVLNQVNQLELQGHFKEAAVALNRAMENRAMPGAEHKRLEFELDRLDGQCGERRSRDDYGLGLDRCIRV